LDGIGDACIVAVDDGALVIGVRSLRWHCRRPCVLDPQFRGPGRYINCREVGEYG
jgi:hypothetical protein